MIDKTKVDDGGYFSPCTKKEFIRHDPAIPSVGDDWLNVDYPGLTRPLPTGMKKE